MVDAPGTLMAAPRVLVLNLGWEQRPLVDALAARGYALYGVHGEPGSVPEAPWADVLIARMRDLDAIVGFADRVRPDAVIADECDYAYFAQALLADRYGLPGPGFPAAQHATNKHLQRTVAAAAGILVPEFSLCLGPADVLRFAGDTGWPVILKPVDNRGSIGVSRVERPEQVADAYAQALINSHSRQVLAERFVTGQHLTIDGYCQGDRGACTLAVGGNRKFGGSAGIVNEAIEYPAPLAAEVTAAAAATAARTADALGYRFGPFHGEFIIEGATGRLYLTEMANRGGGVNISNIVLPFLTDFDLVGRHIDDALGLDAAGDIPSARDDRSALMRFVADPQLSGRRLRAVRGAAALPRLGSVLAFQTFVEPGQRFGGAGDGAGRHAMVIVGGSWPAALEALATEALATVGFDVEPVDADLSEQHS
jgi:biotin carboxylase